MNGSLLWKNISKELVPPGTELFITRRSSAKFIVFVNEDGYIQFPDGRAFKTPSAAARAVFEGGSINGWIRWRRCSDSKTLSQLRDFSKSIP